MVTCLNDGITECALRVDAGKERLSKETQLGGIANVVAGFVSFEAGDEFVGVVEDLLGGAGHGGHLRYFDAVLSCAGTDERRIYLHK